MLINKKHVKLFALEMAKSRAHKLVNGVGQPACNGNNGQHEEQ